jgi:hypothetical protein
MGISNDMVRPMKTRSQHMWVLVLGAQKKRIRLGRGGWKSERFCQKTPSGTGLASRIFKCLGGGERCALVQMLCLYGGRR